MSASATCPRCGGAARWHAQPGEWGCDRCGQRLPPIVYPPIDVIGATAPVPPPPAPHVPPNQVVQSSAPACWKCGGPSRWHTGAAAWGCDRCQHLLPPPLQYHVPPQPSINTSSPFLATFVQIVLVIVVIAIVVALQVR